MNLLRHLWPVFGPAITRAVAVLSSVCPLNGPQSSDCDLDAPYNYGPLVTDEQISRAALDLAALLTPDTLREIEDEYLSEVRILEDQLRTAERTAMRLRHEQNMGAIYSHITLVKMVRDLREQDQKRIKAFAVAAGLDEGQTSDLLKAFPSGLKDVKDRMDWYRQAETRQREARNAGRPFPTYDELRERGVEPPNPTTLDLVARAGYDPDLTVPPPSEEPDVTDPFADQ